MIPTDDYRNISREDVVGRDEDDGGGGMYKDKLGQLTVTR